jgi:hypothetical protein
MESLTFFEVSVEYFRVFERSLVNSCSFHFGVTLEFSEITPASRHGGRLGKPSLSMSSASTIAFGDTLHSAISVPLLMSNRCVNPNVSGFHKSGSTSEFDGEEKRNLTFAPPSAAMGVDQTHPGTYNLTSSSRKKAETSHSRRQLSSLTHLPFSRPGGWRDMFVSIP